MIDLHQITDWVAYWVLGWSLVNILLPPREVFKNCSPKAQQRYNTLLMIIAYYGSLNVRQLTVQLYDSVSQARVPVSSHKLDNALVDAAASAEQTSKSIDKAQQNIPIPVPPKV